MHISKLESIQRREFLRRTAALGIAGTAGPLAMTLAGIGEAAAQTAPDDYKALVCIFLYGGNDHDNTFIPYDDTRHEVYKTLRDVGDDAKTKIYIPKTSLIPLVGSGLASGQQYAVQPSLVSVGKLFNDTKKLGILPTLSNMPNFLVSLKSFPTDTRLGCTAYCCPDANPLPTSGIKLVFGI